MWVHRFVCMVATLVIAARLMEPGILWAVENQRSGKEGPRRLVISGLHGEVSVALPDPSQESKPLRFHEAIIHGDLVTTGLGSGLEVLLGRHALVTAHEDSTFQFLEETPGQTTVELTKGEVRLAVARTEETVTIRTPGATAVTRGGLIRIKINPGKRQATLPWRHDEARPIPIAFTPMTPVAVAPGQTETFQVTEGTIQIRASAPAAPLVTVEAGQNIQVIAGQIGKPLPGSPASEPGYSLPAAEPHTRISQAGLQHLAALQQRQAEALQRVVLGPKESEFAETKNVATGVILSTTGIIISTTGSALTQSQNQFDLSLLFAQGAIFGGATLTSINRPGTGIVDDTSTGDIQFLLGTSEGKSFPLKGAGALLVFDKHVIQAKSELVMVDSGDPRLAPHNGIAPTATLFVTPSPLLSSPTSAAPRQHTGLPLQILNARQVGGGTVTQNVNRNAEVFISGSQLAALLQFSRDNPSTPLVPDPNRDNNSLVIRTTVDANGNFIRFQDPELVGASPNERSIVDGVVRARSDVIGTVANRTVTLMGGAILNNTRLIASFVQNPSTDPVLPAALQAPVNATRQYFNETGQSDVINGSIVGIVAKKDSTSTLRPAFVSLQNRVLAVLDGGTIGPDGPATKIGLLSVLDSQLTGPVTIPSTRIGQDGKSPGVPPLVEIINSNPPLSNPSTAGVQVTSAVVARASGALNGILPVDRGLLEATSPLVALVNSTMTTTSHFADFSGAAPTNSKGLLSANLVPGDALVRLDASSLTVMGNLFNLAGGARASVAGYLFSLTNGSSLTVNGVLVNLAGNSALNLTSTAFGVFGAGANTLTINNNFCASGCTAIAGFPALRVSGGGTVTLPAGFTPFAVAPGAPAPRVNIAPNAAAFQVSPQAQFNVSVRQ